jgi:hypothetical protein
MDDVPGAPTLPSTAPGFVRGSIDELAAVAKARHAHNGTTTVVHVFWGYAGWGETQLLAEIARGGWGLVERTTYVAARRERRGSTQAEAEHAQYDLAEDFGWEAMAPIACLAPKSEYTRYK